MDLKFEKLKVNKIQAPDFIMSPLELKDYIDFDVKRVYFITEIKGNTGQHCHKIEKELFVLLKGTCTATIDYGNGIEEIKIQGPSDALYVGEYVWHGFKNFSDDAILLALSSTNYNPNRSDYIEDYNEYQKFLSERS
ncbi:MAG: FdtA/QdtA family cupin domain-containing protein [Patescibacteria group bacterium]|jgi:mannose-6-phosphate isomerase-like protein (cupin superfamily)|nr:FdtA/QdtA family cupin domain-containing protein [Patescibacteria group bacterium]